MTPIPKRLSTRFLLDPDIAKAGNEVHANIYRLIQAGYFDAAWQVATALLSPGSWCLSGKSALRYSTWQILLWLSTQLRRNPPVLDDSSDAAQMAVTWFKARQRPHAQAGIAGNSFWGNKPSSDAWSRAELDTLVASVRPGSFGGAFNRFQADAQMVLADRVRVRVRARAVASTKPDRSPDHAQLADAIEEGARIAFPKDVAEFAMEPALLAATLDLHEGNRDAVVARLGRLLPAHRLVQTNACRIYFLYPDLLFLPFADVLASHAFAPALGITDAGAAAYLAAFAGRSPYTLKSEKPRPWKMVLRAYAARVAEDGIDAEALFANLQCGEPTSKALLQRARHGKLLNAACSEDGVAALETRLGVPLPPSYREFLLTSDGLVLPDFVSLLPAAQVDWFRNLDTSNAIAAWNRTTDEASDEDYAVYGEDQDCIHMRPRHLRTALQISMTCDGDVLLLIPDVRFGEEWEAWFFGSKNPGAYRFRSFRDLMEQQVLADVGG